MSLRKHDKSCRSLMASSLKSGTGKDKMIKKRKICYNTNWISLAFHFL